MLNHPLLAKLEALTHSKEGRIKLAAGMGAGILLFLLLLFFVLNAPTEEQVPTGPGQAEAPKPAPTPPAPPSSSNSQMILELFSPSDESLTHQQTETSISGEIEQALTLTFVLTKCSIYSMDDYRDVFRALVIYAERSHLAPDAASADARVRQIAESSQTSYALVYSRTLCDDKHLPTIAADIKQWTQQIFTMPPR